MEIEIGRWWSGSGTHPLCGWRPLRFRRALLLGNPSCGEEERSRSRRGKRESGEAAKMRGEKVCTGVAAGVQRASEREREMNET
jgi:hypothetical protein